MPANQPYNEHEILLRIAEGDSDAFGIIFRRYYPLLHNVIAVYALDETDKEDILHETFIRIWLSRDKLAGLDDPAAWFCRIASRECLRVIERNARRQRQGVVYQGSRQLSDDHTPEAATRLVQLQRLVSDALDKMPDQRKRIFLLSRHNGLKPAQIATQLGLSVNTVKNTLVHALKDIRTYLNAAGMDLPMALLLSVLHQFFFNT